MKRRRFKTISSVNADVAARGQDFFARHGGASAQDLREGDSEGGRRGWWEAEAADGYKLRCDWFRIDNEEQLNFSEIPPDLRSKPGGQGAVVGWETSGKQM